MDNETPEDQDGEMSPFVMRAVLKQAGIADDLMAARVKRRMCEQGQTLLANPGQLVDGYQKLLRIIAYAYQIAGAHDCPEHILDVLGDPEGATGEQIDAMLPYHLVVKIEEGDVVQLDAVSTANQMFAACMLVVTEVYPWGVQGYVQTTGENGNPGPQAYYRAENGTFQLIGRAVWMRG